MARSGGSFKPGQSGNPGGKHKVSKELRLFAQQFTEEAILGLVEIARDKTNTAAARVSAWDSVLDRGHGRPMQAVEVTGEDGGPIQSIALTTDDPVEAAKQYQRLMGG